MKYTPLDPIALEAFEVPPVEWVVEDLVVAGSLTLADGREKSGKGLFAIDLLASIALGEDFLDKAVVQSPVLYAFGEENIREVRSREFTRLGSLRAGVPFHVLPFNGQTPDRFSLEDPDSLTGLIEAIDGTGARCVVLDTLREFHTLSEDSSDDMAPLIKPLRQIAHERNVAIIINHHQNKSGSSRGSTAIRASVDQTISLFRTDQLDPTQPPPAGAMPKGYIVVEGRFGPRQVIYMELNDSMRWRPQSAILSSLMHMDTRTAVDACLDAAEDWIGVDEIVKRTRGSKKTVQNYLSELLKSDQPSITFTGTGTKNSPRLFRSTKPRLFPDSGNDGSQYGNQMIPENDSHGQGTGFGNYFDGNQPAPRTDPVMPPHECPQNTCRVLGACPTYVSTGVCPLAVESQVAA